MKGFTKCKNGHYYKEELPACPYCRGGNKPTEVAGSKQETKLYTETKGGDNKTRPVIPQTPGHSGGRTVFGDEVIVDSGGKQVVRQDYRDARKLVGWLVTYSFDRMGADFRLYEGRNVIGRDMDCNITIPDKTMSGKHATILFRSDKFKIKDELSSHGTIVNGNDIESEHIVELHDGDLIQMGETVFKFKVAL